MGALVLTLAAVSGALVPVEFKARRYHTVKMKDGNIYKGRLLSEPGAATLKIQIGGRQRLFLGSEVAKIIQPCSIEQAHDLVAAKIPPRDADSWHAIALECLKKRPPLHEKAVGDLGLAISAFETRAPSHLLLVQVFLRMGEVERAREAAAHFRRAVPLEGNAHYITGEVLTVLGEDPRKAYGEAIRLKPTVKAYLGLVRARMSRGAFKEAEEALESVQLLSPFSIEIDAARGDLALARGRLERAQTLYEKALGRVNRERRQKGADSARVGLASVYYLQGRFDEATKALLDARPTDTRVTYILGLIGLAAELSEGRPAPRPPPSKDIAAPTDEGEEPPPAPPTDSQRLFRLAAQDGFARAYLGLGTGTFLASGGDLAAAVPHFEQAARSDRGDAYAALLAGWSRFRLGRTTEAIADFTQVTVLAPKFAGGHAALAAAALAGGSPTEAVRLYRAGLDLCGGDPGLLAGLGLAQLAAGDAASAGESLAQAHRAGYKGADLYLGLGYLAHLDSDNASAVEWFTWALTAASKDGASGGATEYVMASLPRLYGELGLAPTIFTFDADGEPRDPLSVEARAGPGAVIEGGRLVISGRQERDRWTNVVLPVDGGLFRSASADFELEAGGSTTAGLRLASHSGAVEIACDPEAGIRVRFKDGQKAAFEDWRELMQWPVVEEGRSGRVRLSISMIETGRNLARLELRAQSAPPVVRLGRAESPATRVIELQKAFWRERAFSVILFATSPVGEKVRAVIDNLVLVQTAAR